MRLINIAGAVLLFYSMVFVSPVNSASSRPVDDWGKIFESQASKIKEDADEYLHARDSGNTLRSCFYAAKVLKGLIGFIDSMEKLKNSPEFDHSFNVDETIDLFRTMQGDFVRDSGSYCYDNAKHTASCAGFKLARQSCASAGNYDNCMRIRFGSDFYNYEYQCND